MEFASAGAWPAAGTEPNGLNRLVSILHDLVTLTKTAPTRKTLAVGCTGKVTLAWPRWSRGQLENFFFFHRPGFRSGIALPWSARLSKASSKIAKESKIAKPVWRCSSASESSRRHRSSQANGLR
jgi:hypothetical protein